LLLTKGAGVEGTAILATDFRDELRGDLVDLAESAESFFGEIGVLPDSRVLRECATAMHDPTEGGVVTALLEMAVASDARFDVERESVPVREETRALCDAMDVDPLRIFGSGALLAAVPESAADDALADLHAAGIDAADIGRVSAVESGEDPAVELDGDTIIDAARDDLYALWE
jgi:hydrogenase expression/formation protein HypE